MKIACLFGKLKLIEDLRISHWRVENISSKSWEHLIEELKTSHWRVENILLKSWEHLIDRKYLIFGELKTSLFEQLKTYIFEELKTAHGRYLIVTWLYNTLLIILKKWLNLASIILRMAELDFLLVHRKSMKLWLLTSASTEHHSGRISGK